MGLDTIPTYCGAYDANEPGTNNPPGSDSRRQGDDQIRILKANLKQQFSNLTGAVTATHGQLNLLSSLSETEDITQFVTGTKMLFYQAAAPSGWTIDAAVDEHSVRLTSGSSVAGGTSGGNKDFSSVFTATYSTESFTLLETHIPTHDHGTGAHNHGMSYSSNPGNTLFASGNKWGASAGGSNYASNQALSGVNNNMVNNASGFIAPYGGGTGHAHDVALDVKWAACIICTKN